jgi:hypothetical protein
VRRALSLVKPARIDKRERGRTRRGALVVNDDDQGMKWDTAGGFEIIPTRLFSAP